MIYRVGWKNCEFFVLILFNPPLAYISRQKKSSKLQNVKSSLKTHNFPEQPCTLHLRQAQSNQKYINKIKIIIKNVSSRKNGELENCPLAPNNMKWLPKRDINHKYGKSCHQYLSATNSRQKSE